MPWQNHLTEGFEHMFSAVARKLLSYNGRWRSLLRHLHHRRVVDQSGLFDAAYYLEQNPDVHQGRRWALSHYLLFGWKEGRSPSRTFDNNDYLALNPDVRTGGMNPLLHYVLFGRQEGRPVRKVGEAGAELFRQFTEYLDEHDLPVSTPDWVSRRVAIVGDLNLSQCFRYRVLQKVELLKHLDLEGEYASITDLIRVMNLMQTCGMVIFYRVPDTPLLQEMLMFCRRLGLRVAYDIDDPIFDHEVYASYRGLASLPETIAKDLVKSSRYYLDAIRRFETVFVSTPDLKALIQQHCPEIDVTVVRNAVDDLMLHAARSVRLRRRPADHDAAVLGLASGSQSCEADYAVALPAVEAALDAFPEVVLRVIGHWSADLIREDLHDRVEHVSASSYRQYVHHLSALDVMLIPLHADRFNLCKSAIRYYEASALGIPTIASRTGDFCNVVENGRTGLLVGSPQEWEAALRELIDHPGRRREMGEAAREALAAYRTERIAQTIEPYVTEGASRG
jgi:glycosyltransferase involved in cell wall biosynthesis